MLISQINIVNIDAFGNRKNVYKEEAYLHGVINENKLSIYEHT
jgi:hypothetical protein